MKYVTLLRAINVGGHSVITMAALKAAFESLGFDDVSTYIQTGNVIFSTEETDRTKLSRMIEEKIQSEAGHATTVFLLDHDDLKAAAAHNPFEPARLEQTQRCHLLFLAGEPTEEAKQKLLAIQEPEYRFGFWNQVFYYAYAKEFDGPKRRAIDFEKMLGVAGTARTWKVVDKLIELST